MAATLAWKSAERGLSWLENAHAVFLEVQLALHGLADPEFLDLARDRHRERIDEADVARHLVVRDSPLAEGAHLLLVQRLPRPGDDPGAQLLAVLAVRHVHHLHVLHLRHAVQELDLARG